ncbi:hypothetical protein [Pseudoalteromonas prydzensis]|uniref:hypothetical protein n=1 Tax=Pseudoalteromonas prydzensis TaxID=182141 RepID=UPI003FD151FC
MSNQLINETLNDISSLVSQARRGEEFTQQQSIDGKSSLNVITQLHQYITMNANSFDEATLKSIATNVNHIMDSIKQIDTSQLSSKDSIFVRDTHIALNELGGTAELRLTENIHNLHQQQQPQGQMQERSAFEVGVGVAKGVAGFGIGLTGLAASGIASGAMAASDVGADALKRGYQAGLSSSAAFAGFTYDSLSRAFKAAYGASMRGESVSKDDVSRFIADPTSQLNSVPSEGRNISSTDLIEPTLTFAGFSSKQKEQQFLHDGANVLDSLKFLEDLSKGNGFIDGPLQQRAIENLNKTTLDFQNSADELSGTSKDKFAEFSERFKQCLDNGDFEVSSNEKLKEALSNVVKKLKELFNKLTGNDKNDLSM